MKQLFVQQRNLFFLIIVISFLPGYGQNHYSDTLKSSDYFIEKYGNSLPLKSDSITNYYENAILQSIQASNVHSHIDCLVNQAEINFKITKNEIGLKLLKEASDKISSTNVNFERLNYRIKKCYSQYNYSIRNYQNVIKYGLEALDTYKSYQAPNDLLHLYNLLSTSYIYSQEYNLGTIYIDKSDSLLKIISNSNSSYILNNKWKRALVQERNGNPRKALNTLLETHRYIDEGNYSYLVSLIYGDIASLYYSLRELDKSIQYYQQTIKVYEHLKYPKYPNITRTYSTMARVYVLMEKYEIALQLLTEDIKYERLNNDPKIIYTFMAIADLYMRIDSLDMADKYLMESIKVLNKEYHDKESEIYANTIFYYGHFLIERMHDAKGVELTKHAMEIYKTLYGEKHPKLADTYNYLGKAKLLIDKKPNEALVYLQKALIANDKSFNNSNINTNPKVENVLNKKFQLTILMDKADALKMKISKVADQKKMIEDIELMNNTLLSAIQIIDFMRISYSSVDSKLKMNERTASLYSKLIASSLKLYAITNDKKYLENAYIYTANSKTATLNGLINDDFSKITAGVPEEVLIREKELRIEKGELNNQLYNLELAGDHDSIKKDKINKEIFNKDQEIDLLTANLEKKYKNYYHLKYQNKSLGVDKLQQNLNKKQIVIEYFLTDTLLVGFIITKDSLKLHTAKIDSTFYQAISALQLIFNSESYTYFDQELFNSFKNNAFNLHSSLVAPFKTNIKDKEIVIIPDKELLQLPFEALLTDSATAIKNYRNLPYLISKYPISYSYSTEWLINGHAKKNAKNKLLAIVPSYDADVNYENLIPFNSKSNKRNKLAPIPAALDEAKSIIESIDGEILQAESASESNFKNIANQYSILHFAMHTLIDNNNPMFSKLVFTHANEDSLSGEDNMLNTYEIFNLDLNAQMVVLSSCKSGYGIIQKGEGIMSMARGFIFAGCPSLALTLWSIDDDASSDLMNFYYQNLANGENKAKALQMAKMKFLEVADPIRVHPHFWASHIIIGDTKELDLKRISVLTYCVGILILIILISAIFRKKIIRVSKEFLQHEIGKNHSVPQ